MEKKESVNAKRGMKEGFLFYKEYDECLLNSISGTMTTKAVMVAFNEKMPLGVKLSWNTVHKYLELLEKDKKIVHEVIGGTKRRIHIWRIA